MLSSWGGGRAHIWNPSPTLDRWKQILHTLCFSGLLLWHMAVSGSTLFIYTLISQALTQLKCPINHWWRKEGEGKNYIENMAYFWFISFHLKDIRNRDRHPYILSVTPLITTCMKKYFSDFNFTTWETWKILHPHRFRSLSNSSKTIQCPLQVFLLHYNSRE